MFILKEYQQNKLKLDENKTISFLFPCLAKVMKAVDVKPEKTIINNHVIRTKPYLVISMLIAIGFCYLMLLPQDNFATTEKSSNFELISSLLNILDEDSDSPSPLPPPSPPPTTTTPNPPSPSPPPFPIIDAVKIDYEKLSSALEEVLKKWPKNLKKMKIIKPVALKVKKIESGEQIEI